MQCLSSSFASGFSTQLLQGKARTFGAFVQLLLIFAVNSQENERGKAAMPPMQHNTSAAMYADDGSDVRDWADFYEDYVDAELEEDEEIEQYYFSSAAGRARVVLGNRRWGEGGYMRAGAQQSNILHTL